MQTTKFLAVLAAYLYLLSLFGFQTGALSAILTLWVALRSFSE